MESHDLVAKRLGLLSRHARELLAPQCPGSWPWTKADIADAMREWTARHGRLPRDCDWRRGPGAHLPRLHEPAGKWPDPGTVTSHFGTWKNALFFALCGREWAADVIDPADPTADLRSGPIQDAVGRLLSEFLFDVRASSTRRAHLPDPRWGKSTT